MILIAVVHVTMMRLRGCSTVNPLRAFSITMTKLLVQEIDDINYSLALSITTKKAKFNYLLLFHQIKHRRLFKKMI